MMNGDNDSDNDDDSCTTLGQSSIANSEALLAPTPPPSSSTSSKKQKESSIVFSPATQTLNTLSQSHLMFLLDEEQDEKKSDLFQQQRKKTELINKATTTTTTTTSTQQQIDKSCLPWRTRTERKKDEAAEAAQTLASQLHVIQQQECNVPSSVDLLHEKHHVHHDELSTTRLPTGAAFTNDARAINATKQERGHLARITAAATAATAVTTPTSSSTIAAALHPLPPTTTAAAVGECADHHHHDDNDDKGLYARPVHRIALSQPGPLGLTIANRRIGNNRSYCVVTHTHGQSKAAGIQPDDVMIRTHSNSTTVENVDDSDVDVDDWVSYNAIKAYALQVTRPLVFTVARRACYSTTVVSSMQEEKVTPMAMATNRHGTSLTKVHPEAPSQCSSNDNDNNSHHDSSQVTLPQTPGWMMELQMPHVSVAHPLPPLAMVDVGVEETVDKDVSTLKQQGGPSNHGQSKAGQCPADTYGDPSQQSQVVSFEGVSPVEMDLTQGRTQQSERLSHENDDEDDNGMKLSQGQSQQTFGGISQFEDDDDDDAELSQGVGQQRPFHDLSQVDTEGCLSQTTFQDPSQIGSHEQSQSLSQTVQDLSQADDAQDSSPTVLSDPQPARKKTIQWPDQLDASNLDNFSIHFCAICCCSGGNSSSSSSHHHKRCPKNVHYFDKAKYLSTVRGYNRGCKACRTEYQYGYSKTKHSGPCRQSAEQPSCSRSSVAAKGCSASIALPKTTAAAAAANKRRTSRTLPKAAAAPTPVVEFGASIAEMSKTRRQRASATPANRSVNGVASRQLTSGAEMSSSSRQAAFVYPKTIHARDKNNIPVVFCKACSGDDGADHSKRCPKNQYFDQARFLQTVRGYNKGCKGCKDEYRYGYNKRKHNLCERSTTITVVAAAASQITLMQSSDEEEMEDDLVPFCNACKTQRGDHHKLCPHHPAFDTCGGKAKLERILAGVEVACRCCQKEYQTGTRPNRLRHDTQCPRHAKVSRRPKQTHVKESLSESPTLLMQPSDAKEMKDRAVPFCIACKTRQGDHHAFCSHHPAYATSGAKKKFERILAGVEVGCPACQKEYKSGTKCGTLRHDEKCSRRGKVGRPLNRKHVEEPLSESPTQHAVPASAVPASLRQKKTQGSVTKSPEGPSQCLMRIESQLPQSQADFKRKFGVQLGCKACIYDEDHGKRPTYIRHHDDCLRCAGPAKKKCSRKGRQKRSQYRTVRITALDEERASTSSSQLSSNSTNTAPATVREITCAERTIGSVTPDKPPAVQKRLIAAVSGMMASEQAESDIGPGTDPLASEKVTRRVVAGRRRFTLPSVVLPSTKNTTVVSVALASAEDSITALDGPQQTEQQAQDFETAEKVLTRSRGPTLQSTVLATMNTTVASVAIISKVKNNSAFESPQETEQQAQHVETAKKVRRSRRGHTIPSAVLASHRNTTVAPAAIASTDNNSTLNGSQETEQQAQDIETAKKVRKSRRGPTLPSAVLASPKNTTVASAAIASVNNNTAFKGQQKTEQQAQDVATAKKVRKGRRGPTLPSAVLTLPKSITVASAAIASADANSTLIGSQEIEQQVQHVETEKKIPTSRRGPPLPSAVLPSTKNTTVASAAPAFANNVPLNALQEIEKREQDVETEVVEMDGVPKCVVVNVAIEDIEVGVKSKGNVKEARVAPKATLPNDESAEKRRAKARFLDESVSISNVVVPFCRACRSNSKADLHHALCPKHSYFSSSGALQKLEIIRYGTKRDCAACTIQYELGSLGKHKVEHSVCQRLDIERRKEEQAKNEAKAKLSSLEGQSHAQTTTKPGKRSHDGTQTKDDNSATPRSKKSRTNPRYSTSVTPDVRANENDGAKVRLDSQVNVIKKVWKSCENPWGLVGYQFGDVVISGDGGFTHHEAHIPGKRFTVNPFGTDSGYKATHFSPREATHTVKLARDAMANVQWGFSVEHHDFGGACLVVGVDPNSPASDATFLGTSEHTPLHVHDMIIAVNGKDISGWTEAGVEIEIETSGVELSLTVSRYRFPSVVDKLTADLETETWTTLDASLRDKRNLGWCELDLSTKVTSKARLPAPSECTQPLSQGFDLEEEDEMSALQHRLSLSQAKQEVANVDNVEETPIDVDNASNVEQQDATDEPQEYVFEQQEVVDNDENSFKAGSLAISEDPAISEDWENDDNPWVGCVCGAIHDPPADVFWIQCEGCDTWYNVTPDCIGFDEKKAQSMTTWTCRACPTDDDDDD